MEDALTPTQLNEGRDRYEGSDVTVRGFLRLDDEAICLVDSRYATLDRPPQNALLSVVGLESLGMPMKRMAMREVVFQGTFRTELAGKSGFLLHGCVATGIQIDKLRSEVFVVPR